MPVKSTFLAACDLSLHFHLIILFHEEQEGGRGGLFSVPDCAGETVAARGAVSRLATTGCWSSNFLVMVSLQNFLSLPCYDFVHIFSVAQTFSLFTVAAFPENLKANPRRRQTKMIHDLL